MRFAIVLTLLPLPLIAQDALDFSGLWRANPTSDCVYTGADGSALKIEDNTLFGVENRCVMADPVNVNDMQAQLYNMDCTGEGTRFQGRAMFMRASDGGMYLIWDGIAFKYESCSNDAAVGTVITSDQLGITE